jgi:protein involved in polysaccharide export with SLBB domain
MPIREACFADLGILPGRLRSKVSQMSLCRINMSKRLMMSVVLLCCLGCANGQQSGTTEQLSRQDGLGIDPRVTSRLRTIMNDREADSFAPAFKLGTGDVLEISTPDLDEIKDRTVRVSDEGTIELPLIGLMNVKGMTERQLYTDLQQRLSKFVKDPQLEVFVKQYFSRDVAVVGGVQKPGLYALTSRDDTLLDMINRAGGFNDRGASSVIFIPATSTAVAALTPATFDSMMQDNRGTARLEQAAVTGETAMQASTAQGPVAAQEPEAHVQGGAVNIPPGLFKQGNPIIIPMASPETEAALDIPARPGDVLIVPSGGSVMVQGWVRTPGAYNITAGMTVLGAVTAAGGQMFSSTGRLLRAGPDGKKIDEPINLVKIQNGEEPDLPVQSGDVILINRSATGAMPYFVYFVFSHFGTGVTAAPAM